MPGLGDFLGNIFRPQQAQMPGAMSQPMGPIDSLRQFAQNQPGVLEQMGAGLMSGDFAGGMANAGALRSINMEKAAERQKADRSENMTKRWLMSNKGMSDEEATMAMSNPAILGTYLKSGQEDQERFYGNPIPIEDEQGNVRMGQIGDRGTFRPLDIGKGNKFASPTKEIDIGTEYITVDRFGNELGRRKKENYREAYDTGSGTGDAKRDSETRGELESIASKMPGLEKVVVELEQLSEKAAYTLGGQLIDEGMRQTGMEPREAALARAQYIAMVDNQVLPLLRDTFGAAFTQKEGETLRQTLGDANKSPGEKKAVLRAFIEQKRRDVEALRSRVGGTVPAPAQGGGNRTSSGVTWTIEGQ